MGAAAAGVALTADAAPAPPVAVLRITPNGVGMAGSTEYRFDANGSSDPNQDVLTYSWDFGDGSRGTGVTATHVYRAPGMYAVTDGAPDRSRLESASTSATRRWAGVACAGDFGKAMAAQPGGRGAVVPLDPDQRQC